MAQDATAHTLMTAWDEINKKRLIVLQQHTLHLYIHWGGYDSINIGNTLI